jgi:cytochrome c
MDNNIRFHVFTVALSFAMAGVFSLVIATSAASAAKPGGTPQGEQIAKGSNCFSCHAVDHKVVAGKPGAKTMLVNAVKNGHVGTWGKVPMPPHPKLSKTEIGQVVSWILSLKPQSPSATSAATPKTYSYKIDGKTVTSHVPIFKPGTHNVTADVFRGYELFNSYCFRCHGEDALGSLYAPDLRKSLNQGMKEQKFITIAMEGVKAKGMPSWAGFLTPHEVRALYDYVKGRAIGAVPVGVPKE